MSMDKTPAKKSVSRKSASASTKKAPARKKPVKAPVKAPAKRTPSTTTTKKREIVKRKKRLKLTGEEIRLLEYNPTKTTWKCECGLANSGKMKVCWACGKPKNKVLLWPVYVAACVKVGVEEGTQWKIVDKNRDLTKVKKNGKWEVIDLPEGTTL